MFAVSIFEVILEIIGSIIVNITYAIADFINLLVLLFFGF